MRLAVLLSLLLLGAGRCRVEDPCPAGSHFDSLVLRCLPDSPSPSPTPTVTPSPSPTPVPTPSPTPPVDPCSQVKCDPGFRCVEFVDAGWTCVPLPKPTPTPVPTPTPTPGPGPLFFEYGRANRMNEHHPGWTRIDETCVNQPCGRQGPQTVFLPPGSDNHVDQGSPDLTQSCEGLIGSNLHFGHGSLDDSNGFMRVSAGSSSIWLDALCQTVAQSGVVIYGVDAQGVACLRGYRWTPKAGTNTGTCVPAATPSPSPTPTPRPTPSPGCVQPTLCKWKAGGGCKNPVDSPKFQAGWCLVDSTQYFCSDERGPGGPCDADHFASSRVCCGREWDDPRGPVWTIVGADDWTPSEENRHQVWVKFHHGSQIHISACPRVDARTEDGILLDFRGTGCGQNLLVFP